MYKSYLLFKENKINFYTFYLMENKDLSRELTKPNVYSFTRYKLIDTNFRLSLFAFLVY